jgi:hypothetical protein
MCALYNEGMKSFLILLVSTALVVLGLLSVSVRTGIPGDSPGTQVSEQPEQAVPSTPPATIDATPTQQATGTA